MSNTTNAEVTTHFSEKIYLWNGLLEGELHQDYIVAASKSMATLKLSQENILLLSIYKVNAINSYHYNKKNTLRIFEQLIPLLQIGIPLLQSMQLILPLQSKSWKILLKIIMLDIDRGKTLSQSFSLYPTVFPEIYIHFIRLGELTGRFDDCLQHLIAQQQEQIELRQNIQQALRYPLFIFMSCMSLAILIVIYILPEMENFYRLSNIKLPAITQQLIIIKNYIKLFFPWGIGSLFLILFGYRYQHKKSRSSAKIKNYLLMKIPYLNQFFIYAFLNHFFHALSLLQAIGVPLVQSLTIINESIPQQTHKKTLKSITDMIQNGYSLTYAMQQHPKLFSTLCYQLVNIGEESGKLDIMFLKLHEYHKQILQQKIKKISVLLGPVITLLIAGIISFILFALYLPLFNLGETIH